MNWYCAKLIFEIKAELSEIKSQTEEKLILINAHNHKTSIETAKKEALKFEFDFFNNNGIRVKCKFLSLHTIHFLGSLNNGLEVFSQTYDQVDYAQNHYAFKMREKFIEENFEKQPLTLFV